MKKILLLFCCAPFWATAQNFHFATRLGLAGYHGDLKPASKPLSQLNFLGSIGAQYDLSQHLAARGFLSFTKLRADDKKGTSVMQQRNLNFTSKLWEVEGSLQYRFFNLNDRWWTPYIAAGVGMYHFNPYTKDAADEKVFLRPLSTEGQGFLTGTAPYKRLQFNIPIAIGASYSLNEDARIGLEAGYRKLFTDYLDDVSTTYIDETALRNTRGQQAVDLAWRGDEVNGAPYPDAKTGRGNSVRDKDGYYYIAVTFTLRYWFDKYKQIAGIPSYQRDKKAGCPATQIR
jgi:hypothetical protein